MPWVRFDDQFPVHRKVDSLPDPAFRLHVEAIFWCARNLTDGFVPEGDLDAVTARKVRRPTGFVALLIGRRIWHQADEACPSQQCPAPVDNGHVGWIIHDYWQYQPTREKVLADRENKVRAGRKGGLKSGQSRRSNATRSKREAKPKQGASRLVKHPNPFPSKEGKGEGRGAASSAAAPPPHQGCRRCDGYGWIEQPDGTEARCTSPIFEAGTA